MIIIYVYVWLLLPRFTSSRAVREAAPCVEPRSLTSNNSHDLINQMKLHIMVSRETNRGRRYVMTAMHCVEEASSLLVALGEHNIKADIENHRAKVEMMVVWKLSNDHLAENSSREGDPEIGLRHEQRQQRYCSAQTGWGGNHPIIVIVIIIFIISLVISLDHNDCNKRMLRWRATSYQRVFRQAAHSSTLDGRHLCQVFNIIFIMIFSLGFIPKKCANIYADLLIQAGAPPPQAEQQATYSKKPVKKHHHRHYQKSKI